MQESVLTRPLTDLLAVTFGPLPVLTRVLNGLEGVDQAFIYGSWAARYNGEPGPVPADVDVLVIGELDPDDLDDRAREAENILGREVSVRRVRPATWEEHDDPFVATVRTRPLVVRRLRFRSVPAGAASESVRRASDRGPPKWKSCRCLLL